MTTRNTINLDIKDYVQHSTEYTTYEMVLSQYFVDMIENLNPVENSNIFYFNYLDMQCLGYIELENKIILFNSAFVEDENNNFEIKAISQLDNFYKNLSKKLIDSLDDGNENIDDLLYLDEKLKSKDINVELALFTNAIVKDKDKYEIVIYDIDDLAESLDVSFNVSDINLSDYAPSNSYKQNYVKSSLNDVETYLLFLPASILAKIYEKYHEKLLSNNIRYYLSKNNKINGGILKTILEEPENFVSYNNGISTVCNSVIEDDDGIISINGLQIVNGGQTTATIYEAYKMESDLSKVYVQFKISVIKNLLNKHDKITSIARYANSQNKIQMSDLSANEQYFIEIETFSRNTSIPNKEFSQSNTRWYFERVRGQYEIDKSKNENINFKDLYPKSLKFNKEDLAKYIMSWEQFPDSVSQGAQKNFSSFIRILNLSSTKSTVDLDYYKKFVSMAILFKSIDKIVKELKLGYKNIIVTYTMALYSFHYDKQIDFDYIWENQDLTEKLKSVLREYSKSISARIEQTVNKLSDPNVTTWAKKAGCWEDIKLLDIVDFDNDGATKVDLVYIPKIDIKKLTDKEWWEMASWGKNTNLLEPYERQMAATVAKHLTYKANGSKKELSKKQLMFAEKIYNKAFENGFKDYLDNK